MYEDLTKRGNRTEELPNQNQIYDGEGASDGRFCRSAITPKKLSRAV